MKAFRKANKLTQAELADIIGISRGFIGQIECGLSKLPDEHLRALLDNKNYDTSMLVVDSPITTVSAKASGNGSVKVGIGGVNNNTSPSAELATEIVLLRAEVESLRKQLEKAEAEKEKYWEMIQKLMK